MLVILSNDIHKWYSFTLLMWSVEIDKSLPDAPLWCSSSVSDASTVESDAYVHMTRWND